MIAKRKREATTVAAYLVMLAAALAALGMTAANAWGAPARPDLVVDRVDVQPAAVPQGATVVMRSVVTNAGSARAVRSAVRLYLSADRSRGAGDVLLGERATRALRPGRSAAARTTVVVPAGTDAGSYHVVACADARRVVRERREGNNCRTTATPIAVVVPPAPDGPPGEHDGDHDHHDHDHGEAEEPSS